MMHTLTVRLTHLFGAFSGLAGIALIFVSMVDHVLKPCLACMVSLDSSARAIGTAFASGGDGYYRAAYIMMLGIFLFVWFVAYLYSELARQAGASGWLPAVAFGGGLVTGALLLVQVLMLLASHEVALRPGLGEIGRVLLVLNFNYAFVYAAPLAAMVAATSLVIVRSHWVLRPVGWLGFGVVVITLAWFAPGLGALTALLWLFVLAGALLLRSLLSPVPGALAQPGNRRGALDTA